MNERQAEAWNGPEAAYFVVHADRLDRELEPFTHASSVSTCRSRSRS
jgi:hypothetical protein